MQGVDENEIRRIAALSLDELRTEFLALVEAMRALFDADMEHCMMMDGKDDQIAAIAGARAALARVKGDV